MSDIDFDELDKAVNSLVGDSPSAEKKDQPAIPAPKAAETIEKPQTTSTPSLPSRRAGRFMDMKHDSSDMKKANSPSLMTSTNGKLQPLSSDIKPDEKPAAADKETKNDWPDPIKSQDLESQNDDAADASVSTNIPGPNQKKDEPEIKFEETDPKKEDDKDDDKKPSPFLDDAKVEKRPLGGFAGDAPAEDQKDDKNDKDNKDGDKKDSKEGEEEPVAPPAPVELPPELDKDLVAIEAGEAPENLKAEEPIPALDESNESSKEDDKKDDDKDHDKNDKAKDEKESKKDHKDEVSQLLATAAGGSIPDQYKRENRSHELHTPHPLFDADHHKNAPVSAPKKPKSLFKKVFSWLFIATGILLGGASLGFAAFYFTSQL